MCRHSCDANYAATAHKCHFNVMMEIMVTSVSIEFMLLLHLRMVSLPICIAPNIKKRCMSGQVLAKR